MYIKKSSGKEQNSGEWTTESNKKDVAREAGVSETIVSYVLNKNRYVKEEKRQRVLEVVEKLQYHPNNIARLFMEKAACRFFLLRKN